MKAEKTTYVVMSDHQNAGQSCDMKDGLLKMFLGLDI